MSRSSHGAPPPLSGGNWGGDAGTDAIGTAWKKYWPAIVAGGAAATMFFSCFACCICGGILGNTPEARQRREAEEAMREQDRRNAKANWQNRPRASRENYNRVVHGMTIDQVEAILGPGRENMRIGGMQTLTWSEFLGPTITITFEGGCVTGKSIFGD